MRRSRNSRQVGGGGGGGGGGGLRGVQVNLAYKKKALTTFFLFIFFSPQLYFTEVQWFQWGWNIFQGGPTFLQGGPIAFSL